MEAVPKPPQPVRKLENEAFLFDPLYRVESKYAILVEE